MATITIQNTSRETPVKQQVETNADKKTKFLPPDMAVRIAWALTNQLSESESVRFEANRAIQLMEDIRIKANKSDEYEEKLYVDWVCAAIGATYRDLVTIINGRNLNFDDVKQLRNTELENIKNYSQFTTNLQSSIPRISVMTFGGVSFSILLTKLSPNLGEYFLPLLALGAVIGYFLNGAIIIPFTHKKMQIQKIKLDYDRNRYYEQYVERSKAALTALYLSADRHHNNIFKNFYDSEKAKPGDVKIIIDEVLGGISSTMCKNISKCMIGNIVTLNKWSICETGLGIENCPNNKNMI